MSRTSHNLLSSRANLRAQRHVRSQQTNQATLHLRQQTQVSETVQERSPKPIKCFPTFVWKYNLDAHSPLWKKLFHRWVYLPFVRFAWDKMGIVLPEAKLLPNANLPHGALLVKEWQGVFTERWKAEQEASKHLHGGYTEVAFDWSETAATTEPRSVCPASPCDRKRRDRRNWEEAAALEKLQETLVRTRPQVEALRSMRT